MTEKKNIEEVLTEKKEPELVVAISESDHTEYGCPYCDFDEEDLKSVWELMGDDEQVIYRCGVCNHIFMTLTENRVESVLSLSVTRHLSIASEPYKPRLEIHPKLNAQLKSSRSKEPGEGCY